MLYFAIAVPLPVAYVVWLVKSGRAADFHLPDRRDRTVPFLLALATAVCAFALLVYFGAPAVFLAPVATVLAKRCSCF